MATLQRHKYVGKSKYKYVNTWLCNGLLKYRANIKKYNWHAFFDEERDAAIAVDKYLISKKLEPVNILVRKPV